MSAAYISIGIFTSSITNNQIIAFLLALVIGIFFQILFKILANALGGNIGNILVYADMNFHYQNITRGVIDSKDIIYFFTLIILGLAASELSLLKRNLN